MQYTNADTNASEHSRQDPYSGARKHYTTWRRAVLYTPGQPVSTFKTVAGRPSLSREGSTPSHSRHRVRLGSFSVDSSSWVDCSPAVEAGGSAVTFLAFNAES